jgi:hypothetical protein
MLDGSRDLHISESVVSISLTKCSNEIDKATNDSSHISGKYRRIICADCCQRRKLFIPKSQFTAGL